MVENKKKTVVVFGATGGLGVYLVESLAKDGWHVLATGRSKLSSFLIRECGIDFASIDITNPAAFEALPTTDIGGVIHLAGAMPARMKGYDPHRYIRDNIEGTLNVLEYARACNANRFVFTQSHSDVAGYWNTGKPIPPDANRSLKLRGDHAVYIISKNAAVDLLQHYHEEFGLRTVVLRLPTVYCYSPIDFMYVNGEPRPVYYLQMIQKAIRAEPLEVWGNPSIEKDIVYVKDFNQLVHLALTSDKAHGIYNVGTGRGVTLQQQVEGIAQVFSPPDRPSPIVYCPEKPGQVSYLYDISNAQHDLGYVPRYSYIDMLKDMKNEMLSRRFYD